MTDSSTRLVLGCGNFGGIGSAPEFFGRGESREDAFAIMDFAWELGLTWFDTADAYGGGRSEAWIGEWIRARGVRPRLTTKTFNPMEAGADHGLAPERIRRQLDSSLERLGVERVDVYLLHEPDPDVPLELSLDALEGLQAAGKVAEIGVSNFGAELLSEAAGRSQWVQNSFSLLERGDESEVLPICVQNGVGYQAFSPLAGGWLTGKYRRGQEYPEGSRMTLRPGPYRGLLREEVFDGLDALRNFAQDRGLEEAAVALAWTLAHPGVDAVIVGPRRPDHLEPARRARELELSPDELAEIGGFFA